MTEINFSEAVGTERALGMASFPQHVICDFDT